MRNTTLLILTAFTLLLSSCKENKSLGTVTYHPSFLWSDESLVSVDKTMDFDFSDDAKNDPNAFAELQFTDNNHNPISTDVLQVSIDGTPIPGNKFRVGSNTVTHKVTFSFTPEAKDGKYQGVLLLVNHDLDRLDTQVLSPGQQVEVMQWTLHYDKSMNPLANGLLWLSLLILAVLLLWFALLRRMCYPVFKGVHKMQVVAPYFSSKTLTGKRMLVFCAEKPGKPQSSLSKLFTGEIVYEANPLWHTPMQVVPAKKSARISTKPGYLILAADGMSLPTKWVAGGEYVIEILDKKEKVKINII